jgi:hypothetical protein
VDCVYASILNEKPARYHSIRMAEDAVECVKKLCCGELVGIFIPMVPLSLLQKYSKDGGCHDTALTPFRLHF